METIRLVRWMRILGSQSRPLVSNCILLTSETTGSSRTSAPPHRGENVSSGHGDGDETGPMKLDPIDFRHIWHRYEARSL
jgi:hypothetical protein